MLTSLRSGVAECLIVKCGYRTLRPEEKSKALHNRFVVDDRVSVLEELDSAIEIFLNTVDKKKMEDQEQGW